MSQARRSQRQMIANRLASRLHTSEALIDEALHEFGLICAELPKMRQEASLSATFGQDLFHATGETYAAMVEARSKAVKLHNLMECARLQLGVAPITASVGGDKPSDPKQDVAFGQAA